MNEQEKLIKEVSEATGADIVLSPDGTCDFAVDDAVVTATYRPDTHDWLLVTTVLDADENELPPESLAIVLRQSLFGAGTLGFVPGLFANAIMLSGALEEDGLTAEGFVAVCERLARARAALSAHLDGLPETSAEKAVEPSGRTFDDRIFV